MKNISRKNFTILLGNAVDHFDTSIYAFLAPIMAPIFFPSEDPVAGLMIAYSIFATSIITRPIGTYIFCMIAKNTSPSVALSHSLIGVGIATFCIGLLPAYNIIGIAAPILLIIFRMIREIFEAGESAIAKLYILENLDKKESFATSYLYQISTICGMLLASIAATCVYYFNTSYAANIAWRIVFLIGGIAAIIGYIIRKNLTINLKVESKKGINFYNKDGIKILWEHKIKVLAIAIVNSFSHLTYAIPFITMNHLVPLITNIEEKTMMVGNNVMLVFDMVAIYFIGKLLARLDLAPSKIMIISSLILAITIIPLWYFMENASFLYISLVRIWIVLWGVTFLCPLNLWCASQISGEEKYIIVGMGTTIGGSLIGKMTPWICLVLYYKIGSHLPVAIYLAFMFTIVCLVITKSSLIGKFKAQDMVK